MDRREEDAMAKYVMTTEVLEGLRDLVDKVAKTLEAEGDLSSREEWMALDEIKSASRNLHSAFANLYIHDQKSN